MLPISSLCLTICLFLAAGLAEAAYYAGYSELQRTNIMDGRDTLNKSEGRRIYVGGDGFSKTIFMTGFEFAHVESGTFQTARTSALTLNANIIGVHFFGGLGINAGVGIAKWRVDYSDSNTSQDGNNMSQFINFQLHLHKTLALRLEWNQYDMESVLYPGDDIGIDMRGVGLSVWF